MNRPRKPFVLLVVAIFFAIGHGHQVFGKFDAHHHHHAHEEHGAPLESGAADDQEHAMAHDGFSIVMDWAKQCDAPPLPTEPNYSHRSARTPEAPAESIEYPPRLA